MEVPHPFCGYPGCVSCFQDVLSVPEIAPESAPNVALQPPPESEDISANEYLLLEFQEKTSFGQITVCLPESGWTTNPSTLNPEGLKKFQVLEEKASHGDFKDTLSNIKYIPIRTGLVFSKWGNLSLGGVSQNRKQQVQTSLVIFVTDNWAYTQSGSLYRLNFHD